MSSAPTTPLRQRMIEDMSIRQFGERTQHGYVSVVADFARFLGRSPDQAQPEDRRRYQLHLATQGVSPGKMNAAVSALRFFFKITLGRQGYGERLARVSKEDRLPEVLSPEEVALLLHCAPSLKYKAALSVAYGCGLRVSEITHLKVGDIDGARMLIRFEQGTGAVKMATMALSPAEFIRRFLIHVLPSGFHRIRHYGLLAKGANAVPVETLRALILERTPQPAAVHEDPAEPNESKAAPARTCPCGGAVRIIEVIGCGGAWRARPLGPLWCDSS